ESVDEIDVEKRQDESDAECPQKTNRREEGDDLAIAAPTLARIDDRRSDWPARTIADDPNQPDRRQQAKRAERPAADHRQAQRQDTLRSIDGQDRREEGGKDAGYRAP